MSAKRSPKLQRASRVGLERQSTPQDPFEDIGTAGAVSFDLPEEPAESQLGESMARAGMLLRTHTRRLTEVMKEVTNQANELVASTPKAPERPERQPKKQPEPVPEEVIARKRYTEAEQVLDALEKTVEGLYPVRLLRMSWLLEQRDLILPKRQDLPEEAFISPERLRRVWNKSGKGGEHDWVLPIVAVSSAWDTPEHPDPTGARLKLVQDTLRHEQSKYTRVNMTFRGCKDMGVFWDWPSLFQADPSKSEAARETALKEGLTQELVDEFADMSKRTTAEAAAFDYAMKETMDLWFGHRGTTVLLLTEGPKNRAIERPLGYEDSGWIAFERACSTELKIRYRSAAQWAPVLNIAEVGTMRVAKEKWPMSIDQFDELADSKAFAVKGDRELAKAAFLKLRTTWLGGVDMLDFEEYPKPTPKELAGLGRNLKLCKTLKRLDMRKCKLTDDEIELLAEALIEGAKGGMKKLSSLRLCDNSVGDRGAVAIAKAMPFLPNLSELGLNNNKVGALGAGALAEAFPTTPKVEELQLHENKLEVDGALALCKGLASLGSNLMGLYLDGNLIGDEGISMLAEALSQLVQLRSLWASRNRIGDEGVSALCAELPYSPNLIRLDLNGNMIGNEGAESIATIFPQLNRHFLMYLNSNHISDIGADAIARGFPTLRDPRAVYTRGNPFSEELRQTLLASTGGRRGIMFV